MTLLDSFYTITLTDPGNKALNTIYTGSYGKADSHGLIFEKTPVIPVSPYIWKDGSAWDRTSRNIQGDAIYLPGTYTISVSQNLNHMAAMYADLYPDEKIGLLVSTASITFIKPESTFVQTTTSPVATPAGVVITTQADLTPASTQTYATTQVARTTKVPAKTTYAPLPLLIVLAALGLAVSCAALRKK
jgi:hypothetical protein